MKLQEMPKLCQFAIQILVHGVKALLKLLLGQLADTVVGRVMVDIWQEDGLRKGGPYVFS